MCIKNVCLFFSFLSRLAPFRLTILPPTNKALYTKSYWLLQFFERFCMIMTRGKLLNDNEKGQIIVFHNMEKKYGSKKSTERPNELTQCDKGKIFQEVRQNKLDTSKIKTKLDLSVGVRRVQQVLRLSGTFKYTKKAKQTPLTKFHKKERLKFAKNHMSWTEKLKTVISSDEKQI
ncbi:uncharacterized protein LOC143179670 [Calliopsis andreniformis]|uniref:uncharacterized protein LOC143179670 n=1 Tax=Calliopsis andreniformis TaxID=337506 RepID=UPI003FCED645